MTQNSRIQDAEVLTIAEAAARLRMSAGSVTKHIHDRSWPTPVIEFGQIYRIPTHGLDELIANGNT